MEQQQTVQMQQPMPQGQMQMQAMPFEVVTGDTWKNGLFSCGPCSSCMLGCCVPCILVGRTADRMRDPSMRTADNMNSDCLIHGGLTWFAALGWVYQMMKRTEIRERFDIPGSGVGDCCTSYWCPCCAVIQQDKEVADRLRLVHGQPDASQQGYQSQNQGMVVPPAEPQPAQKEGNTAQT
jgi:Cys-rich protein (TIGR01571 family)